MCCKMQDGKTDYYFTIRNDWDMTLNVENASKMSFIEKGFVDKLNSLAE